MTIRQDIFSPEVVGFLSLILSFLALNFKVEEIKREEQDRLIRIEKRQTIMLSALSTLLKDKSILNEWRD